VAAGDPASPDEAQQPVPERDGGPGAPSAGATYTSNIDGPARATATSPRSRSAADGPVPFPDDLFARGRVPRLIVRSCSQLGVALAFDSSWLEHDGFRASMPMRSAFSPVSDRSKLIARPLAFIDRSGAAIRSAQELEAKYEQHLLPGWTARHLLTVMGLIDVLPRPFNLPMPYYVDLHTTGLSLVCSTRRRVDGGLTCEVMIPNGLYALEWLGRVNGVCGPEHTMLEEELAIIHSDTWTQLPEVCRQRVVVWCHFHPRERFITFVSDAEFAARDLGLAGLVLTDHRLIYHKYHHNAEFDIREDCILLVREDGGTAHLSIQAQGKRTRLIRIDARSLDALKEHLRETPSVRVVTTSEM
jgi:hypothetical protein